jgi:hypothetical protein
MRIGVVVDGDSEYASLGPMLQKLAASTGHTYLRVIKADLQPFAPPGALARECLPRLNLLRAKGADRSVVLIDRETRPDCPGRISAEITSALHRLGATDVVVVIKDATYENWLLADIDALRCQPRRFRVTPALQRQIEPDRADGIGGVVLMRRIAIRQYDKVADSQRIMRNADPARIGYNSRSFRKFLQQAGCVAYSAQTRRPVG